MSYAIKEIFYTLQGEGANSGRAAVFCRFSGCNLWSGREIDRQSATCRFCDTDFRGTDGAGGGRFETARELASAVRFRWPGEDGTPLVVLTGGEPMLQVDDALIDAVHATGMKIAIESNGTLSVPRNIDWICISPKAGAPMVQTSGDELKLVYPQVGVAPRDCEMLDFKHFFLQPMDGKDAHANTTATVEYCRLHPKWRLSLQVHKIVGIP